MVRDALNKEQFDSARQWRERAYKYCEQDGSMATLDGEIKSKEEAVLKAKAEKEAKKKNAVALAKLVANLASQGKADASVVAKSAKCPEDDKGKEKEGWCAATRSISGGQHVVEIRYWSEEKNAGTFIGKPLGPVECADIAPATVNRKFGSTIDGTPAKFSHCTFTGGTVAGMQGLVGWSDNLSFVQLFTPEYLAKDSALKNRVQGTR